MTDHEFRKLAQMGQEIGPEDAIQLATALQLQFTVFRQTEPCWLQAPNFSDEA